MVAAPVEEKATPIRAAGSDAEEVLSEFEDELPDMEDSEEELDPQEVLKLLNKRPRKQSKRISSQANKHNPMTHFPKDPNCPVCRQCKSTRAQCRQKGPPTPYDLPKPQAFGDSITADHTFIGDEDLGEQDKTCV